MRDVLNDYLSRQARSHKPGPLNGKAHAKAENSAHGAACSSDTDETTKTEWPNPLAEEAYHGLVGGIVRAIEPHTEADPVALLMQLLTGFGNSIGRTAHFRAEGHTHYLNLFIVLVGRTSKGRKGSSWSRVHQYLKEAEPAWAAERIQGGLASGEGMVHAIRDPVEKSEPIKGKTGRIEGYQTVIADAGETDKRLLCLEEEYAGVLRLLERQGNTLSQRLREAWQGQPLGSLTKNSPTRCAEPHVSIIGHVTAEEVRRYLSSSEMANGFGNRHLWLCVKRSKCLPDGSLHEPVPELVERLRLASAFARTVGELHRDPKARTVWHAVYADLSKERLGLTGAMLGRAEAQVMRLAGLYAVLDGCSLIGVAHMLAALAVWDYVEASVRYVFGDSTGDPIADEILSALRKTDAGLTRTDIHNLFGRNQSAGRISKALALLLENGLACMKSEQTDGKRADRWQAVRN